MRRLCLAALISMSLAAPVPAQTEGRPRLYTNQTLIEDVTRKTDVPLDDPVKMFAFVLGALPDRVKVYPTENYYYFSFFHGGVPYAGNIRLDRADRDDGKVHFAYYQDASELTEQPQVTYRLLDRDDGVTVEKLERFLYRVSLGGRSVLFELNDLSGVRPPADALAPDEKFLGPIFDESGIRFFLIFNPRLKIFHYVLDETVEPADEFFAVSKSDERILIGKRTGFAFYRDHRRNRKILIGVYERNAFVNNYYDGPFDQLPDNFVEGDELRDAILAVAPWLKGKIDRFGASPGGEERYLIGPYAQYRVDADLLPFHTCATSKRVPPDQYYACFVNAEEHGPGVRPTPLQAPKGKGKKKR
jgi:hypothetical protein